MLRFMKSNRVMAGALAALIVVAAHATAAKGAKGRGTVAVSFDDAFGDGIQSDGYGTYTGTVGGRNGTFKMSTGEDSLFFDFSHPIYKGLITPFGSDGDSGLVSGVDVSADYVDGDPGTSGLTFVVFDFVAPNPDGSGPTDWRLSMWMVVDRQDANKDGEADTFVFSRPAADPYPYYAFLEWHTDPVIQKPTGPRRYPPEKDDGWYLSGSYDMDWGAVIEK
jgi:hypothetical protein